jgi:hypothetical protein
MNSAAFFNYTKFWCCIPGAPLTGSNPAFFLPLVFAGCPLGRGVGQDPPSTLHPA